MSIESLHNQQEKVLSVNEIKDTQGLTDLLNNEKLTEDFPRSFDEIKKDILSITQSETKHGGLEEARKDKTFQTSLTRTIEELKNFSLTDKQKQSEIQQTQNYLNYLKTGELPTDISDRMQIAEQRLDVIQKNIGVIAHTSIPNKQIPLGNNKSIMGHEITITKLDNFTPRQLKNIIGLQKELENIFSQEVVNSTGKSLSTMNDNLPAIEKQKLFDQYTSTYAMANFSQQLKNGLRDLVGKKIGLVLPDNIDKNAITLADKAKELLVSYENMEGLVDKKSQQWYDYTELLYIRLSGLILDKNRSSKQPDAKNLEQKRETLRKNLQEESLWNKNVAGNITEKNKNNLSELKIFDQQSRDVSPLPEDKEENKKIQDIANQINYKRDKTNDPAGRNIESLKKQLAFSHYKNHEPKNVFDRGILKGTTEYHNLASKLIDQIDHEREISKKVFAEYEKSAKNLTSPLTQELAEQRLTTYKDGYHSPSKLEQSFDHIKTMKGSAEFFNTLINDNQKFKYLSPEDKKTFSEQNILAKKDIEKQQNMIDNTITNVMKDVDNRLQKVGVATEENKLFDLPVYLDDFLLVIKQYHPEKGNDIDNKLISLATMREQLSQNEKFSKSMVESIDQSIVKSNDIINNLPVSIKTKGDAEDTVRSIIQLIHIQQNIKTITTTEANQKWFGDKRDDLIKQEKNINKIISEQEKNINNARKSAKNFQEMCQNIESSANQNTKELNNISEKIEKMIGISAKKKIQKLISETAPPMDETGQLSEHTPTTKENIAKEEIQSIAEKSFDTAIHLDSTLTENQKHLTELKKLFDSCLKIEMDKTTLDRNNNDLLGYFYGEENMVDKNKLERSLLQFNDTFKKSKADIEKNIKDLENKQKNLEEGKDMLHFVTKEQHPTKEKIQELMNNTSFKNFEQDINNRLSSSNMQRIDQELKQHLFANKIANADYEKWYNEFQGLQKEINDRGNKMQMAKEGLEEGPFKDKISQELDEINNASNQDLMIKENFDRYRSAHEKFKTTITSMEEYMMKGGSSKKLPSELQSLKDSAHFEIPGLEANFYETSKKMRTSFDKFSKYGEGKAKILSELTGKYGNDFHDYLAYKKIQGDLNTFKHELQNPNIPNESSFARNLNPNVLSTYLRFIQEDRELMSSLELSLISKKTSQRFGRNPTAPIK